MIDWKPRLSSSASKPLYRRLVEAMAADIHSGRLAAGARLPPQRTLADALSISVGSVTRAYEDAMRRGLLQAHVGRGTYVIDRAAISGAAAGEIDLAANTAPIGEAIDAVAETIASLRRVAGLQQRMSYLPPCGLEIDRRAGVDWIHMSSGLEADWTALLCCPGAQAALALATSALCRAGDVILCEAATFSGMKALAAQQGYRLHGVAMDSEGMLPAALDRAAAQTGARALYALPTLQNPTARVAGRARREAIVRIARARDLQIIEDDVYGAYARSLRLPTLAELAPERTLFVTSLSKTLSAGLRVGYLLPPRTLLERCIDAMRALQNSPPGLGTAVATDWIASGRAQEMLNKVRAEVSARSELALQALDQLIDRPASGASLHLWMPLPELEAERAAGRALRAGLRVSSPGAGAVSGADAPSGLRLCIGAAANRATLQSALTILKTAVRGGARAVADQL